MVVLSIRQQHLEAACAMKSGEFELAEKAASEALSLCEKDIYGDHSCYYHYYYNHYYRYHHHYLY